MNNNIYYNPQTYQNPPQQQVTPNQMPPQPTPSYVPYYPAYPIEKKEYKELDKKDMIFIFVSIILGFLFFNLSLFARFNLGFTIFYVILFVCTTIYLKGKKATPFPLICGALSLVGSAYFTVFNDDLMSIFMFVLIMGLYAIYCTGLSDTFNHRIGSIKSMLDVSLNALFYPFKNLPDAFGSMKASSKKNKSVIGVIIGIAVSLPVLVVVIPLLVKSDAAFEGLVKSILENIGVVIFQLILGALVSPFIFSYFLGNKRQSNKKSNASKTNFARVPSIICTTFLTVISLTYVVYLFSQLAYFFSAFKGILPDDYEYTASAFARRGFYEMFAICVINVLVITAVNILTKRNSKRKVPVVIKSLSAFISAFSVLLIATAMQKMKLNISIFGYTRNRILVSVLMIMLLVIIAFFILHIFAPKLSYVQPIIICCSLLFIVLAFSNVDSFVAKYNIDAYNNQKIETLDVEAISSSATVNELIALSQDKDKPYSDWACSELMDYVNYYFDYEDDKSFETNGKLKRRHPFDVRRYNVTTYDCCNTLSDYFNSMSAKERQSFQERVDNYYDEKWKEEYREEYGEEYVEDPVVEEYNEYAESQV